MNVQHILILALIQLVIDVKVFSMSKFNKHDRSEHKRMHVKVDDRDSYFKKLINIRSSKPGVNQYHHKSRKVEAQGKEMSFESKKENNLRMETNMKIKGKQIQQIYM